MRQKVVHHLAIPLHVMLNVNAIIPLTETVRVTQCVHWVCLSKCDIDPSCEMQFKQNQTKNL